LELKNILIQRHKKTFLIFLTSVVVVGGIFVLNKHLSNNQEKNSVIVAQRESEKTFESIVEKDSDSDGLKDWEEALWKTDPKNADSDADGTSDGEEVRTSRNPAMHGPDDSLVDHPIRTSDTWTNDKSLTETDKFSRALFTRYMTLKQAGVPLDAGSQTNIIQSMLNEETGIEAKIYKASDIKTTRDENEASIRRYGNDVGAIILRYSTQTENEGVILRHSLETNDPKELQKLDVIISGYKNIFNEMLKMNVPASAQYTHLDLINSMSSLIVSIEGMRKVFTDPVLAMRSVQQYPESAKKMAEAFIGVKNYFLKKNITYLPEESGYAYMNVIR
jgi:hypothetical protein